MTIDSQIGVIRSYLSGFQELQEAEVYIDNGFTGTNFERPAFRRMMQDVQEGRIRCIAVKDLSRLGRNYIETGNFIEKICTFFDLRLISVNERFDSGSSGGGMFSAPVFNVINDLYAKDISKKTCTALRAKRQKGEFVGGYAPHGYQKDPQDPSRLIVDPETAPVIRQIFLWRAEGLGYGTILKKLNEMDIPSPGRYRFENGIRTNNNGKGRALLWNRHVLTDILKNEVYIGHLVQGKQLASYWCGIPMHTVSPDEWAVSRNAHEPIIAEELFARVQEVRCARHKQSLGAGGIDAQLPKKRSVYGKKLVCAGCGAVMRLHRSISRNRSKAWFTYICPTYAQHGKRGCQQKNLRQAELDNAVLESVRVQLAVCLQQGTVFEELRRRAAACKKTQPQGLLELERRLAKKRKLVTYLYTDFKDGLLDLAEYQFSKDACRKEIAAMESELRRIQNQDAELCTLRDEGAKWIALAKQYAQAQTLTVEMVDALVSEVRVRLDGSIEVAFRFSDVFKAMREKCSQLTEEGA